MPRKTLMLIVLAAGLAGGCGRDASAGAPPAAAPAAAATDVEQRAAACAACHQGGLTLAKYTAPELRTKIVEVRDGKRGHPPVGLDGLGEDATTALAARLAGQPGS